MSQSYSCVAKRNSTIMVIIKLKTILNEKGGYLFFHFFHQGCSVTKIGVGTPFPPHYTPDLG